MANERLSLLLDTRATGDAELKRLEATINGLMDKTDRVNAQLRESAAATKEWAVNLALLVGSAKVISEIATGLSLVSRGYVEQRGQVGALVDAYRGLRLAVAATEGASALFFTGATLGAGILLERLTALSNSYAKVIEQQSLLSARGGGSLLSQRTFGTAGAVIGQDLGFLKNFNPDEVRDYIKELEGIPDPLNRATRAVELFGDDAEKAFALLGTNIGRRIDQARDLAEQLGSPQRASLQRLRDDLRQIESANPFSLLLESFRQFRAEASQGIAIRVAAVFDSARGIAEALPSGGFSGGEGGPGISAAPDPRSFAPSYNDFRRLIPDVLGSPRTPALPGASAGQLGRARAAIQARGGSIESLRSQLSAARETAGVLGQAVSGGGALAESSAVELLRTENLIKSLEKQIETVERLKQSEQDLANLRKSVADDTDFAGLAPQARRQAEAGRRFGTVGTNLFVPLVRAERDQTVARATALAREAGTKSLEDSDKDFRSNLSDKAGLAQFGLRNSIQTDSQIVQNLERSLKLIETIDKERLDRQVKLIELTAGPNGELGALRQIYQLRLASAKTAEEAADAQIEFLEKAKRIEEQRRRDSRETDGKIFDALVSGGGGIKSFLSGTLLSSGRTAFQNTNEILKTSIGDKLTLPGQRNSSGSLNTFGKVLQGTLFGDKGDDKQITAANIQMAAAQLQLKAAGGSTAGISSIAGSLGLPTGLFQGAGSNPLIFSNNSSGGTSNGGIPIINELGEVEGYQRAGLSTKAKVGIGAAAVAGGFGVAAGINQGGLRGGLTATASAAGAAAAILPLLSTTLAAAGPIGGLVALGAGLIGGLLPDPKKQREAKISSTLDNARYVSPSAMNYASTIYGDGFDYNKAGSMRPIIINQTIQAMDSKSIIDRRSDIAEATRLAIQEAAPLNEEIKALSSNA